jgi:hypothetical protein
MAAKPLPIRGFRVALEAEPPDPWAKRYSSLEASFFHTDAEKDKIRSARRSYPRHQQEARASGLPALPFENQEDKIQRRVMGFGLGFEKIFATTSYSLPISAHTIFAELRTPQSDATFKRLFNGHNSVLNLKQWIYEKTLVPNDSYALSYAEAGKANLYDNLPLLTMHDSLDTRTLATTRAVRALYKGTPGVHSLNDIGVTQVYARLKCRKFGDLLIGSQASPEMVLGQVRCNDVVQKSASSPDKSEPKADKPKIKGMRASIAPTGPSLPSVALSVDDPNLCDAEKYVDCVQVYRHGKHCFFNSRGYELFEAARASGFAELARIDLSCDQWPSSKQQPGKNVLFNQESVEPRY